MAAPPPPTQAGSASAAGSALEEEGRRAVHRLQARCLGALLLIASIVIVSQAGLNLALAGQRLDAGLVNLAGRQRMLSQRVVKGGLLASTLPPGSARRRAQLGEARADLRRLRSVHAALRDESEELGVPGPAASLAGGAAGPAHAAFVAFDRAAGATLLALEAPRAGDASDAMPALLAAGEAYLARMEALVGAYEHRAGRRLARTRTLCLAAGGLLLLALGLQAAFLFRPGIQRIRRQMLALTIAQERTRMLATAAEHTRHAVLLAEADGTISWLNPAARAGFSGGGDGDAAPNLVDAAPARAAAEVRAAIAGGEDLHLDDVQGGGGGVSSAVDLVAVRDAAGAARRWVLVLTDLSERAQRERSRRDVQRRAGRADVALTILHNVGNTLNSLSLAAEEADATLRRSRLPALARAAALLDEDPAEAARFLREDPRGAQLPRYLQELGARLHAEHEELQEGFAAVRSGVTHLRHVVSQQNASAEASAADHVAALEPAEADDLIAEALRVYGGDAARRGVEVEVECSGGGLWLRLDRHATLQILGNLLSNAARATAQARGRGGGSEPVRVRGGHAGPGRGFIEVADGGVGVEPEDLPRLFAAGYSTRAGSDGIGLHASANAASAMGGRLTAHSDGPGAGATFRVELPTAAPGVTHDQPLDRAA